MTAGDGPGDIVALYAVARQLDELAWRPLEALASLFGCETCAAPPSAPCSSENGPHAARLEEAAAARAEWLTLRCPEGLHAHRVWDRKVSSSMPGTALFRASGITFRGECGNVGEKVSAPALGRGARNTRPAEGQLELYGETGNGPVLPHLSPRDLEGDLVTPAGTVTNAHFPGDFAPSGVISMEAE